MYHAEFTLESLTPIFMRGADQSKAEIRAASIKGLMRWWFRALAGSYFGDDVEGLRKAEEYVFGSTGRKSGVIIEIAEIEGGLKSFNELNPADQLRYLWFSVNLLARKGEMKFYYPSGTKFTIVVKSSDEAFFNIALASLWALVSLGGVGFRSRRGAGSLKFSGGDLDLLEKLSLRHRFGKIEDLRNSILSAIKISGSKFGRELRNVQPQPYPILSENTSSVSLWDARTGNPIQALRKFQGRYQRFRRSEINKRDRIIFGLPVGLRGRGTREIQGVLGVIKNERRGSPMHIGITHIGSRVYVRIVKFRTEPFHPDGDLNNLASWRTLGKFDTSMREISVFGSLEVFK
jgi:CRISPR-associated protein Cmr1